MKKLMVAAAIVCAAVISQAASVSWSSGAFTDLPSCYGFVEYETTGCGEESGCINAYVWESLTAFSYTTAEEVYNAYKSGELNVADAKMGTSDAFEGTVSVTGANTFADGDTVYAAILYLHNKENADGTFTGDIDYYMANLASAEASDAGADLGNLGNSFGGSGGAATAWTETAAIPEPTSGLLLLLGMAGLALRRRRA